jgi:hypothetical protein
MDSSVPPSERLTGPQTAPESNSRRYAYTLGVFACIYALLIAVGIIGDGFNWLAGGKEGAKKIFGFATDPVVGLMAGMLATALIQSSSTVTSGIVGLVAGGASRGHGHSDDYGSQYGHDDHQHHRQPRAYPQR